MPCALTTPARGLPAAGGEAGAPTNPTGPPARSLRARRGVHSAAAAASDEATNSSTCSPVTRYTTRLATDTAWSAKRS